MEENPKSHPENLNPIFWKNWQNFFLAKHFLFLGTFKWAKPTISQARADEDLDGMDSERSVMFDKRRVRYDHNGLELQKAEIQTVVQLSNDTPNWFGQQLCYPAFIDGTPDDRIDFEIDIVQDKRTCCDTCMSIELVIFFILGFFVYK